MINSVSLLRVSSNKQGLQGDSPEDQQNQILIKAATLGIQKENIHFQEMWESASGELDMQPIQELIAFCKTHTGIKYCFVKDIGRGTRGGATIYGEIKSLFARIGVQMVDVYGIINPQEVNTLGHLGVNYKWSKFSPSWTNELLEAERMKSEVRDILTRMIGAEIRYIRNGYWIGQSRPGYINEKIETLNDGKRTIMKRHPIEADWFIKMFELTAQGNISSEKIIRTVNHMGYESRIKRKRKGANDREVVGIVGGNKLTMKEYLRFIENPIYAGIIVHSWTNYQPVKAKFDGLVSIELWNQANRGKQTILLDSETVRIYRKSPDEWQLKKDKDNPQFPYKNYVGCPKCGKPFYGSSPKGKLGTRYPTYHCDRKHKYYGIPAGDLHVAVKVFCGRVKISNSFMIYFRKFGLEELNKRRDGALSTTMTAHQQLINLSAQKRAILDKIDTLTNTTAIQDQEAKLANVEAQVVMLKQKRDKAEDTEVSMQTLLNHAYYLLEHLDELLLGSHDMRQNAEMFGILFDTLPTLEELTVGTPSLAPLFELNDQFNTGVKFSSESAGARTLNQ